LKSFLTLALLAGTVAWPAYSSAIPPERVVLMEAGDAKYELAGQGSWVAESTNPKVVKVKYIKTAEVAEVLLEAGEAGTALIVFTNKVIDRFSIWKVRVADKKPVERKPDPSSLSGLCECGMGGKYPIRCTVKNAECLEALRKLFQDSDLINKDVWVKYNIPGAQALLRYMQAKVAEAGFKDVELALGGGNLRITGRVADEPARRKLLLLVYQHMVGKFMPDDRLTIEPAPAK
jgi:hypothetical protein